MAQNNSSDTNSAQPRRENLHTRVIRSIKAQADAKRTWVEKLADWITASFGSITFLALNVVWFFAWIFINTGQVKSIQPFDPFPFNLLTMVVSLEAIILAIFVLISQNRSLKVDDLREELHLQVNLIAEQEITKTMQLVATLLQKNGVDLSQDAELQKFLKPISEDDLEKKLEKEM